MLFLRTYSLLLGASLRSRLQYKRSFLMETVGRGILTVLELFAIIFLFEHVEEIAGWRKWEVVYLFGAGEMALGMAELMTSGLNHMPQLVRSGELDRVLVRPVPTLAQLMADQADFYNLGRIAQGSVVIPLAFLMGGMSVGGLDALLMVIGVLSCAMVFAALFICSAATCFWTVESGEVFNAFTYGGVQMVQFPLGVYPRALGLLFVFAIPVGLTIFYPAMQAFGKADPLGLPAHAAWFAPVAGPLSLAAAGSFWRFGINRYQSTGS